MRQYTPYLDFIDRQAEEMRLMVTEWAKINTHYYNTTCLRQLASLLKSSFSVLGAKITERDLPSQEVLDERGRPVSRPLGPLLAIRKRPESPLRILLGIHTDTVYPEDHPFQEVSLAGGKRLRGPGVADAKGGLAVMLKALEAFERSPFTDRVGWEVFVNPDEEIGSPGSSPWIGKMAARTHLAILFEPALEDGSLVSNRRGTGKFSLVVRGRSAHAGREPERGRNAVVALSEFIVAANRLNRSGEGVTLNIGRISGGGPVNVVPDMATTHFMVRAWSPQDLEMVRAKLDELMAEMNGRDGVTGELSSGISKPPKLADGRTIRLLEDLAACGSELGMPIRWQPSSGVSDGNEIAAYGLPTVDSLGVCGGGLHSPEEYLEIDSLTERAKLVALYLMKLGSGELNCPVKQGERR